MTYDHKPSPPMPLIEVAGMLERNGKGQCAAAVRNAMDKIKQLESRLAKESAIVEALLIDRAWMTNKPLANGVRVSVAERYAAVKKIDNLLAGRERGGV